MNSTSSSSTESDPKFAFEYPVAVEVQHHVGPSGDITVIDPLPLDNVRRAYLVQLGSADVEAGFHAHKALRQVFVAVLGQLRVRLSTPERSWQVILSAGADALSVPPAVWRVYSAVDGPATLLVLASASYDENDYIRDWREYVDWHSDAFGQVLDGKNAT